MALTDEDKAWIKAQMAHAARVLTFVILDEGALTTYQQRQAVTRTLERNQKAAHRVDALIRAYEPGSLHIGPDI